jgi:segregation and condensation protein B
MSDQHHLAPDERPDAPVDDPDGPAGEPAADASDGDAHRADPVSGLKPIVEALVFASPEPLPLKALCKMLSAEPKEDIEAALAALREDYAGERGLQLVEDAGGFQSVTRPEYNEWVRRLFHERTTQKLSVQALETLAVIAYRQPVTAPEITEIRGVNTSGVLGTLLERKLVKIVGRKPVVGRPFMYATTREFLDKFGLRDLADLPKVEDMADMLGFEPPSGLGGPAASDPLLPFDGVRSAGEGAEADTTAAQPSEPDEPGPSVH